VTTGARSGLRPDPFDPAHPQALVDLVQRAVQVSPAAQAQIAALPPLTSAECCSRSGAAGPLLSAE
jgi:hypothetical protein